jgi:hypothetical protein
MLVQAIAGGLPISRRILETSLAKPAPAAPPITITKNGDRRSIAYATIIPKETKPLAIRTRISLISV